MSEKAKQIRQKLQEMARNYGPSPTLLATVKSVNESEGTCILDDDGITYQDVRLHVVLTGNEAQHVSPKVGSYVLALRIEHTQDWYVVACEEIEKWSLKIGTAEVVQESDGLLIQNSVTSLKEILTDIVSAVQVIAVVQGSPPDYVTLTEALTKINSLLK